MVSETAVCEGLELYMMWPELSVGVVAAISPRHSHILKVIYCSLPVLVS